MNRIGRHTIVAMLLIAALALIWNVLGQRPNFAGFIVVVARFPKQVSQRFSTASWVVAVICLFSSPASDLSGLGFRWNQQRTLLLSRGHFL
jgi:hypothetical protein